MNHSSHLENLQELEIPEIVHSDPARCADQAEYQRRQHRHHWQHCPSNKKASDFSEAQKRRRRDSDPRRSKLLNTLAGCPFRPLRHVSNYERYSPQGRQSNVSKFITQSAFRKQNANTPRKSLVAAADTVLTDTRRQLSSSVAQLVSANCHSHSSLLPECSASAAISSS